MSAGSIRRGAAVVALATFVALPQPTAEYSQAPYRNPNVVITVIPAAEVQQHLPREARLGPVVRGLGRAVHHVRRWWAAGRLSPRDADRPSRRLGRF